MAVTTMSYFFANRGTLAIAGDGGTPASETLGVIKDLEIVVSAEHVPLFGWGSIKRVAVARHTAKVGVRVGFMKFLPKSGNMLFYIADPTGGTGALVDTNTVKLFDITGTFVNEAGETLTLTINDVYFPSFPMKASEGQWIRMDLDGEGNGITPS